MPALNLDNLGPLLDGSHDMAASVRRSREEQDRATSRDRALFVQRYADATDAHGIGMNAAPLAVYGSLTDVDDGHALSIRLGACVVNRQSR